MLIFIKEQFNPGPLELGLAAATLFVAIFPLAGLLAAIFIPPEVYGYEAD